MIILNSKINTAKNLLFISFALFIVVPTLSVGMLTYMLSVDQIKQKVIAQMHGVVEHQGMMVEERAADIERFFATVSMSDEVQLLLQDGRMKTYDSALMDRVLAVDALIESQQNNDLPVDNVLLVSSEEGFYYNRKKVYFEEKALRETEWYAEALRSRGGTVWAGTKEDRSYPRSESHTFHAAKAILSRDQYRVIGVAFLALKRDFAGPYFVNMNDSSHYSVLDRNGRVLLSSNPQLWGSRLPPSPFKDSVPYYEQSIDGTNYLMIHSTPNRHGWTVVQQIPLYSLTYGIANIRNFAILVITCCLAIFAVFLALIYRKISLPLQHLVNFVNDIENNYKEFSIKKFPIYEFLKIGSGFLSLVESNKHTKAQLQVTEKKSREMEIGKLQAQIHPHFLYNTLNSIKYIAVQNEQKKISELLESFVIFLRSSINKSGKFVTLAEELVNLRHYIFIQDVIYNHRIGFVFETDDTLHELTVPNFILQPLVENSILHGLEPGAANGKITIRTYSSDADLILEVEDNGVGMTDEQIEEILYGVERNSDGLGIRATNEKIKIIYGIRYGIRISSRTGEWTKVSIKLPMVRYPDGSISTD